MGLRIALMSVVFLSVSSFAGAELARPVTSVKGVPDGKVAYQVLLSSLPDRSLVGQPVDIVARRISDHSAYGDDVIPVLSGVPLIASPEVNEWGASTRQATFALDEKELKKLKKYESRLGYDLLVRSRDVR
jgi:hypothetical protein